MADSVEWDSSITYDGNLALVLEDSIRRCAAFSGIHDQDFGNDIEEAFADLTDWTTDTTDGTTWNVGTGQLVITGGGGGDVWYQGTHSTEVEPSFLASFDLVSGQGGFIFHGKNSANDAYVAYWTPSTCGIGRLSDAKALTKLSELPYGISGPARVQVAVKWRLDSVDDSRKWLLITLFVDGREFVGYADDIGGTASDWTGEEVGFAVNNANTMTVDNLTVSEVSRIVDYTSVDVGEPPAAGMARAIGTTQLDVRCRYDGTLRVRRPGDRGVDWAIPASGRVLRFLSRSNLTNAVTHVRSIGAIYEADAFDDAEGDVHMHRFVVQDDPNIVSESETYEEAERILSRAKELQGPATMQMNGFPLIEPSDRVTFDGGDYRVVRVHHTMGWQGQGVVWVTMAEVHNYEGS